MVRRAAVLAAVCFRTVAARPLRGLPAVPGRPFIFPAAAEPVDGPRFTGFFPATAFVPVVCFAAGFRVAGLFEVFLVVAVPPAPFVGAAVLDARPLRRRLLRRRLLRRRLLRRRLLASAAGFFAAGFFAADFFAAGFFAAGFFAAGFFAAGFFAAGFSAAGLFAARFLVAGFLSLTRSAAARSAAGVFPGDACAPVLLPVDVAAGGVAAFVLPPAAERAAGRAFPTAFLSTDCFSTAFLPSALVAAACITAAPSPAAPPRGRPDAAPGAPLRGAAAGRLASVAPRPVGSAAAEPARLPFFPRPRRAREAADGRTSGSAVVSTGASGDAGTTSGRLRRPAVPTARSAPRSLRFDVPVCRRATSVLSLPGQIVR